MQSGGALLAECLINLGATRAYGVPGESYLALLDALYDRKGQLNFINCRHEGGASFMAAAEGKLTGQPGICLVTRGPGATNASIGVHTAMQDSVPMLLFVGHVATGMKGREAFQELDYRAVFGSMAKWVVEIHDVERLPELVMRAWKTAISGRPGPVVVALPEDMLADSSDAAPLMTPIKMTRPQPDPTAYAELRAMFGWAKKPLVLFGGADWSHDGRKALQSWAEAADIPVLAAFRYQDQYDNHSFTYVGDAGVGMAPYVKALLCDADLILAIGVRFGENVTDGYTALNVPLPHQKLVHVHASEGELGKIYQPDLAVQADSSTFALGLPAITCGGWEEWRADAMEAYERFLDVPVQPSPVDMGKVTDWLQTALPEDAILTNGAGNFATWSSKFFRYGVKQRLLAPQSGAMGYGVPAAVAASLIHPDRTVVCFAGDGDFQMTGLELATALQIGAKPIILLVNNGIYGTIRAHQERHYPTRVSGTDLRNPDFTALAQAMGCYGEKVEDTSGFPDAFSRAAASDCPAVLELVCSPEALTAHKTLSDIRDD